jgi:hypothetical protein
VLFERGRGGAPCKEVRALAARKLADVEARLRELLELRGELRAILGEWDSKLSQTAEGERAGLLESLAERPKPAGGERRGRAGKRETPRAPLRPRAREGRKANDR